MSVGGVSNLHVLIVLVFQTTYKLTLIYAPFSNPTLFLYDRYRAFFNVLRIFFIEGRKVQGKLRKLLMILGGHASIDIMTVDERSGSQEVFLDLVFLSNLTKRTRASHLVM